VKSCALLALVLLAATGLPVGAQGLRLPVAAPRPTGGGAGDAVSRADSLFEADHPLDALDLLEAYLGRRPSDYDARWRAARAAVVLGIMAGDEAGEQRWLGRGIRHAQEAVARRPDGIDGLYWLVASRGWLAMVVGNPKRIADLADDVYLDVRRLLEMAPDHAGGHHALGKLHYEVMKLSAVERFIGRHLMGVDIARYTSWEASVEHLERAVELQPDMILYRLDLGMTYYRWHRPTKAREALRAALALPSIHTPDPLFKQRARALLQELEAEEAEARPGG
jgi:tetratricopeptide (TPR) repeat protein